MWSFPIQLKHLCQFQVPIFFCDHKILGPDSVFISSRLTIIVYHSSFFLFQPIQTLILQRWLYVRSIKEQSRVVHWMWVFLLYLRISSSISNLWVRFVLYNSTSLETTTLRICYQTTITIYICGVVNKIVFFLIRVWVLPSWLILLMSLVITVGLKLWLIKKQSHPLHHIFYQSITTVTNVNKCVSCSYMHMPRLLLFQQNVKFQCWKYLFDEFYFLDN